MEYNSGIGLLSDNAVERQRHVLGADTSELQSECAGYFKEAYKFLEAEKYKTPLEVMVFFRKLLKERETKSDPAAYKRFLDAFQHLVYKVLDRIRTNRLSQDDFLKAYTRFNNTLRALEESIGANTGLTDDELVDMAHRRDDEERLFGKEKLGDVSGEEDPGDVSGEEDDDNAVGWGDVIESKFNFQSGHTVVPGSNALTIPSNVSSWFICRTIKAAINCMIKDTRAREVWNDPTIPLYVPSQ